MIIYERYMPRGHMRMGVIIKNIFLSIVDMKKNVHYCNRSNFWNGYNHCTLYHCIDVMISLLSQIIGVSIVCSGVCSGTDKRKHLSSASLAFVKEIHR